MAVLSGLPTPQQILSLKKRLDFYVLRGQVVCRSWPRPPAGPRTPAVQAAGQEWARFSKALGSAAPLIVDAAKAASAGQPWTYKDILTSAAYSRLNYPWGQSP